MGLTNCSNLRRWTVGWSARTILAKMPNVDSICSIEIFFYSNSRNFRDLLYSRDEKLLPFFYRKSNKFLFWVSLIKKVGWREKKIVRWKNSTRKTIEWKKFFCIWSMFHLSMKIIWRFHRNWENLFLSNFIDFLHFRHLQGKMFDHHFDFWLMEFCHVFMSIHREKSKHFLFCSSLKEKKRLFSI